jgi:glutamate dehydrogenase
MITSDPQARAARIAEVLELLRKDAAPEDRDLLLAFAPAVFVEMPDRLALGLSAPAIAARIADHFRFVAREMPPPTQLYKGLPGIHVRAANPTEAEALAQGARQGLPLETTVVHTHSVDMPFIFDSLKNYYRKAGLRVFSGIHPVFTVRRQWERVAHFGGPDDEGSKECYTHFQVERVESKERLRRIEHEVFSVLKCVFVAVEDFPDMKRAVREIGPRLRSRRGRPEEEASARDFLDWLLDNNYILMGTVQYRVAAGQALDPVEETATGVFRDMTLLPVVFPGVVEDVEARLRPEPDDDRIFDIDFSRNGSAIYHIEPIDDIVVREWGPDGSLAKATVLLGRFARRAFAQRADEIPLLKAKHDWLLEASGTDPNSHIWREIKNAFNHFPKTELFYATAADLQPVIDRIVYMSADDEIAVHCRKGKGYETLYIAFSKTRYSYQTEEALKLALADAFGPIAFEMSVDCGAVTLFIFYYDSDKLDRPLDPEIVRKITTPLVTTWEDRVAKALEREFGEREGRRLLRRYIRFETRSGLYRESTPPEQVPDDVRHLESLEARLEVRIIDRTAETVALNLYSVRALGLTDILRTLTNLGLTVTEELRVPLVLPEGRKAFLYRFEVEAPQWRIAALHLGKERFIDALRALDEERATDDPLNSLILLAGLAWREVEVLRTLRSHLLQIRTHYNAETVNGVLNRNGPVAAALFKAFAARFDPAIGGRAAAVTEADAGVRQALEAVRSLAEDEVLRALDNLIRSALRTNFYQVPERPVFSIKVDSRKVEGMPTPRPMFEIYVHSRLLEGIHLRGGKVARGGIRWSDRHDDFRTEVLGLMKTQMVKNSVIVPVGSKGGFVLKGDVPSRPALDAYLVDRYREFVSGLLDVTDNILDDKVVHPPEVTYHDGDDPYLVVAADKGTAHLSDTANSVSAQYGFWLGDAFASGGSAGYDHKKMGITARGAWECVKHHFKNLGIDVQKEPFTMAGVGDMAGDVFGNGALQSRCTKLLAAFNHIHIFIDPEPDPERSYQERERLFNLPRSTWRDYDASLISAGGGVFDRSAKAIPLSAEMKKLLELDGKAASGEEVIRRILTAKVDLLYNGGIGTYVKSAAEEDADVGDRANDRVRVDGKDVRARVVGEGGNLGFTQKGRLEYWERGGHINTDAVDNSGGVDTSDHEVNIKILLDPLVKKGIIKGREERNRILREMTEEVAALVLADNANQALALSLDGRRSRRRYEEHVAYINDLVGAGLLNRSDEAVPSTEELLAAARRERGLPRPLLAVLLGYTKMSTFEMLLQTDFPDGAAGRPFLDTYFPHRLRESYGQHFQNHFLRREIVATGAVNQIVNQAGVTFLSRTMTAAGAALGDVVTAYVDADREAEAGELRAAILGGSLAAEAQQEALLELEAALEADVLDRLAGKKKGDAAKTLKALRARLAGDADADAERPAVRAKRSR